MKKLIFSAGKMIIPVLSMILLMATPSCVPDGGPAGGPNKGAHQIIIHIQHSKYYQQKQTSPRISTVFLNFSFSFLQSLAHCKPLTDYLLTIIVY